MSKVELKLINKGFNDLRNSKEVQELLLQTANDVASSCEGNYDTDVRPGKTRANASIITRDFKTYHLNLKNNELLKKLGI